MITIETKIYDFLSQIILLDLGRLFGKISRKYFVDRHIKKKPQNDLKKAYQKTYGISARHFNSMRSETDAKVRAYEELLILDLNEKEAQILSTQKTIKKLDRNIKSTLSLRNAIKTHKEKVQTWRAGNQKKKKPKLLKKLKNLSILNLNKSLKKLRFKRHQKKRRLGILRDKRRKIEKKKETPSLCFGSKVLFRKQFHLRESGYSTHQDWKLDWQQARDSQSFWIGSHDESFRNQNAQYDPAKKTLSLRIPKCLETKYGTHCKIENVKFPYGQELLEDAILHPIELEGKEVYRPVSFRLLERTQSKGESQFYCQAIFQEKTPELESDARLGAIGIDLNADHLAMVETDRYGNPVFAQSYPFSMENQSSDQIAAVFGDHIATIVARAKSSGKIIVCENLDFAKKKSALRETAPKGLRVILSSFAYKKFFTLLQSRCSREGVYLKSVNPAFTSVIGFYKFSGYGIYTSHECAALSIARRGLRFSERAKTKGTPSRTVSIERRDEVSELSLEDKTSSTQNSDGHVWSFYSRNAKRIRKRMFESSASGRKRALLYNPRHPSGYKAGMRCDGTVLRSLSP